MTKTSMYIFAIVGIVALVSIVVLFMNIAGTSMSLSDDISGQAVRMQSRSSDSDTSNCQCGVTTCMNPKGGGVYECCKACR